MDIAWRPTERYLARSRLRRFAEEYGHGDFASLYRWSVEDLDGFWRAVDRDLGLVWQTPYERVLDASRGIPWTTWWVGGRMNYVATALPRRVRRGGSPTVSWRCRSGGLRLASARLESEPETAWASFFR